MNEHEVRSQEQSARHLMERVGKACIEALERERDHNLDSIDVGNAIINKKNERIAELEAANQQLLNANKLLDAALLKTYPQGCDNGEVFDLWNKARIIAQAEKEMK